MASDKKPSIYSERSAIGSSEELDEYGVWVKSGPQDLGSLGADMPEAEETLDFSIDLGDGEPAMDISVSELPDMSDTDETEASEYEDITISIPEEDSAGIEAAESIENLAFESGAGDIAQSAAQGGVSEEASTELLLKISGELSVIRNELASLKKEFASFRSEGTDQSGFFAEEEDEKIALTGDEMNTILSTASFSEASDAEQDLIEELPPVEEFPLEEIEADDEPALAEDISEAVAEEEELTLDIDDLNLDIDVIEETPIEEAAAEEISIDNEITADNDSEELDISFDEAVNIDLSSETEPADEEPVLAETELIDDNEDLQHLRIVGAEPLTPAPENISYLEDEPVTGEPLPEEPLIEADAAEADDSGLSEIALDTSLDETSFDLETEEYQLDTDSIDLSQAIIDEPDLSVGIIENPVEEPVLEDIQLDDDFSIELDEAEDIEIAPSEEAEVSVSDEAEDTIELEEPVELEETIELEEEPVELEETIQLEEEPIELEDTVQLEEEPIELEDTVQLEEEPVELEETIELEEEPIELEDTVQLEEEPVELEETIVEDTVELEDAIELENFPVEETVELEDSIEPEDTGALEGIEDLSLDINFDTKDDSLAQIIPEGFEIGAQEAPAAPFEDDLEPFVEEELAADPLAESVSMDDLADETVTARGNLDQKNLDIPVGLQSELKRILTYMDQLLESLPEEKIDEFARSEYFDSYKKLFKELGLV